MNEEEKTITLSELTRDGFTSDMAMVIAHHKIGEGYFCTPYILALESMVRFMAAEQAMNHWRLSQADPSTIHIVDIKDGNNE